MFSKSAVNIYVNDYKKGNLTKYDSVFVINIENEINNTDLLDDLANYKNSIY